jgi:hypothetical protein
MLLLFFLFCLWSCSAYGALRLPSFLYLALRVPDSSLPLRQPVLLFYFCFACGLVLPVVLSECLLSSTLLFYTLLLECLILLYANLDFPDRE